MEMRRDWPNGQEHEIKCWPEYYEALLSGEKTFEVRKDDRGYAVGDVLLISEWSPTSGEYTGREGRWEVTYVLKGGAFGVEPGYVVMGLHG